MINDLRALPQIESLLQDYRITEWIPKIGRPLVADAVRATVDHLEVDRPLFRDHNNMTEAVKRCDVLVAVEDAIGPLLSSW